MYQHFTAEPSGYNTKFRFRFLLAASLVMVAIVPFNSYGQAGWLWGRYATGVTEAWAVATDNTGNVYAAGYTYDALPSVFGAVTVPATASSQAVWVKYNATGTALWAGTTLTGISRLYDITTDPGGNLIVFGYFYGDSTRIGPYTLISTIGGASPQYFLAKINPSGTVLWAVNDGRPFIGPFITGQFNYGNVSSDDSGNIYISFPFKTAAMSLGTHMLTNADPSGFTSDICVAKYSPSGSLAWVSSFGGSANDCSYGTTVLNDGTVFVAGTFISPSMTLGTSVVTNAYSGTNQAFIAKLSPAGVPVWGQAATGPQGAYGLSIKHDNSNHIYLAGNFYDNSITFGSLALGRAYSSAPNAAGYLVQYSPSGVPLWGRVISSGSEVTANCLAVSPCNRIWISGGYSGAPLIAPGDTMPASTSSDQVYATAYDFSGTAAYHTTLTSGGDDLHGITCDPTGNLYLCSDYYGSFVAGPDTLLTTVYELFFIAKYGYMSDTVYTHHDTTICAGGDISHNLQLTVPPGGKYLWYNGDTTNTVIVDSTGNYWVKYINGCTAFTDSYSVVINSNPSFISGPGNICRGDSTYYHDSTGGGRWHSSVPAVASIDSVSGFARGLSGGITTITYTAATGCYVSKQVTVSTLPCHTLVPAVINNDQLVIAPNPSSGHITITLPQSAGPATIIIRNTLGKIVETRYVSSGEPQLFDFCAMPGTYIAEVVNGVIVYRQKVLIW